LPAAPTCAALGNGSASSTGGSNGSFDGAPIGGASASPDDAGGRPPALASRDGPARGGKRLQQHARRELLSRAWSVVAGGAADVARFRGARSITPPAHVAAREAQVAAAGAGGGEKLADVIGRLLYRYYLW
jgi:hypothetical protein